MPPRPRHTGFKAVSTGWGHAHGYDDPVIADLIRNPQGEVRVNKSKPTNHIPSPLMGEESKVRVNKTIPMMGEESKVRVNKTSPSTVIHRVPNRHSRVGGNPQGGRDTPR